MLLTEFDYDLPPELIAQTPLAKRDESRLLVLSRSTGAIEHYHFYDLPDILSSDTVIVLNNTKVFRARLFGHFYEGEKSSEVFLLKKVGIDLWQCLCHPGRKFFPGKTIRFLPNTNNTSAHRTLHEKADRKLTGTVKSILEDGSRVIQFDQDVSPLLEYYGHTPLPPYIKTESSLERYQTVYAKESGSVAAPTAGLHFTREVLEKLGKKGVEKAEITLHVGAGTFQPVKVEEVEKHVMHYENYTFSPETAEKLNRSKQTGKKILAVGTTSTRVLESCVSLDARSKISFHAQSGHTNLFIYPGYTFTAVDHLLTNFHLPKSTLLMLVSAFAGKELIMKAYDEAIKKQYRFFSFGDAMLIL